MVFSIFQEPVALEMKLGQTMSSQNNMLYMEYGVTLSRGDTREQVYSRWHLWVIYESSILLWL